MTTPTTNLGLLKGVDADNWRTYLKTDLAASLDILDRAVGPVVSVLNYGADRTGATDSGPAFNNALAAACAAGGGVVIVPAGTFKITTQVVIPCSGIELRGDGEGCTVLTDTGAADFGTGLVHAVNRSRLTLRDLTVRPSVNGFGVYIEGGATQTTDVLLERVTVDQQRSDGSGVVLAGGAGGFARVTLRGVRARSPASSTGTVGIQVGPGTLPVISTDLLIEGCTTDGFVTGIHNGTTGTWQGVRIADCRFEGAAKWGAYLYHMDHAQVVNCEFALNDVGAFMDDDSPGQGGLVANCLFRNNLTIGLYREEWAKGALVGCSFQGNGYGFWVASARTCAIVGCSFYANTRSQILVEADTTITSLATSGPALGASYAITNVVAIQDLVISGCSITGGSSHGIEVAGVQRGFKIVGCDITQNGRADNPTPVNYAAIHMRASAGASNNYAVEISACTIGNIGGSGTDTGYQKWGVRAIGGTITELSVLGSRIEGVDNPVDAGTGGLKVEGCTFKTCGTGSSLATGYQWAGNTIVGGTMTPPVEVKGADTAAANNLVLTPRRVGVPNVYRINGGTQINFLANTGWPSGSIVVLIFSGTPTVKNSFAGSSGANRAILLAGSVDFVASANDTLTLVYDHDFAVAWYELCRTVI